MKPTQGKSAAAGVRSVFGAFDDDDDEDDTDDDEEGTDDEDAKTSASTSAAKKARGSAEEKSRVTVGGRTVYVAQSNTK